MQKEIPFIQLNNRTFAFGEEVFYHQPRELRTHTHGCPKSQRGLLLGFSRRKKGYDVITESSTILEGVFDVFFTGEFPLREEADRYKLMMFEAKNKAATKKVLEKHGFPDGGDDETQSSLYGEPEEIEVQFNEEPQGSSSLGEDLKHSEDDTPNPLV